MDKIRYEDAEWFFESLRESELRTNEREVLLIMRKATNILDDPSLDEEDKEKLADLLDTLLSEAPDFSVQFLDAIGADMKAAHSWVKVYDIAKTEQEMQEDEGDSG